MPFPARLLDCAMPRLSDTEWRLLCVVVRQTLGWYDRETGGRKERDWLTQAQLVARTGRTAKPIAEAVAALTAQQMIRVLSDRGDALTTPQERRGYGGRHWFQMHPKWPISLNGMTNFNGMTNLNGMAEGQRAGDGEGSETTGIVKETKIVKEARLSQSMPCRVSPHGKSMDRETRSSASEQLENGETPAPVQVTAAERPDAANVRGDGRFPHPSPLWQVAQEVFTVEKVYTTKETDYKYKTQKKNRIEKNNEEGVEKVHTENEHRENECFVPGRDLLKSLPEQRLGSGPQESQLKENLQKAKVSAGSAGGGNMRAALTIYGPSTPQGRATWEQEAAGKRWAWRKDLKQWVKAEEGSEGSVSEKQA